MEVRTDVQFVDIPFERRGVSSVVDVFQPNYLLGESGDVLVVAVQSDVSDFDGAVFVPAVSYERALVRTVIGGSVLGDRERQFVGRLTKIETPGGPASPNSTYGLEPESSSPK